MERKTPKQVYDGLSKVEKDRLAYIYRQVDRIDWFLRAPYIWSFSIFVSSIAFDYLLVNILPIFNGFGVLGILCSVLLSGISFFLMRMKFKSLRKKMIYELYMTCNSGPRYQRLVKLTLRDIDFQTHKRIMPLITCRAA